MSDEGNQDYGIDTEGEEPFKILIATDCHLGYEEKSNRGQDSFTTFEEILKYAKQNEVDFILLGGDLFHDNKPSQAAVLKCMNLLRKYCLGTRPNKFQFLSDPKMIFNHCLNKTVNFEDPNLNVEIPVFSIHGNHDDPSGTGQIGSLDILSVTGLINYFGKWTNLKEITVAPLLFRKGNIYLALYGLSYIKDQRLSRLLRDGKVDMLRPNEIDDCFNIFVLHQNRVKHSDYSFIPEDDLPNFLDFIFWGHEHECRIDPEFVAKKKYRICQPGSPVATSLCQSEAVEKYVGILHVHKKGFNVQKLKLKTVRPFVFETVNLNNNKDIKINKLKKLSESIENYVDHYIEHVMMPKAAEQITGDPRQPTQPLLRLRLIYTEDEQMFETFRLEQKYFDQVANSNEIILLRKQKLTKLKKEGFDDIENDDDIMEEALGYNEEDPEWNKTVQGGIKKYFASGNNKEKLTVLSINGLNEALSHFVDKSDSTAIEDVVKYHMEMAVEYIKNKEVTEPEDIIKVIDEFRRERDGVPANEEDEIRQFLKHPNRVANNPSTNSRDEAAQESDDQTKSNEESPVRGRGRGRGRRARGGRGSTQSREKLKVTQDSLPVKTPREEKQKIQNTQTQPLKQASITSHFLNKNSKKAVFISDSDSDSN